MKRILMLLLVLMGVCGAVQAQAEESCGPKSNLCWPVVKRDSSGPRVTAVQYLLRAKGFQVAPDGRFGYSTESALRKFQAKNKLKVDGKVGWQSWEALTPPLKRGAKGDAVRALQTLLQIRRKQLTRDGVFGRATQQALQSSPIEVEGYDVSQGLDDIGWCYLSGGGFMAESD